MFFDLANIFLPYLGVLPRQLEEMAKRCQHFQVLKGEKLRISLQISKEAICRDLMQKCDHVWIPNTLRLYALLSFLCFGLAKS